MILLPLDRIKRSAIRLKAIGFIFAILILSALPAAAQHSVPNPPSGFAPSSATRKPPRRDVAQFRARVDAILAEAHSRRAFWGVFLADRDTGETVYELNAGKFFTPGSTTKIFTTVFALATLGPEYRYRTYLASNVPLDTDGVLAGDLVLIARGDPDLSNRKFPYAGKAEREGPVEKVLIELAEAAVAKGLKKIDGDVVVDDSFFPFDPYPAGSEAGDQFFPYGAPISALAFNENAFTVSLSPGQRVGDPAVLTVEPGAAAGSFGHEVTTVAAGEKTEVSVVRRPGLDFILLRGRIPLGGSATKADLAMTSPAETAALALKQLLEARGVRIAGTIHVVHAPPPERNASGEVSLVPRPPAAPPAPAMTLAEHASPPLLESIRLANKISQNLHTELFLRTVAAERIGAGTTDAGLKLEQEFLKTAGVIEGDVILNDGSGISNTNMITPRSIVQVLQYAAHQPWSADFISTLSTAGVDGWLEFRMQGTPAAGRIQAKTGTHSHHHTLAGYATTLAGENLVFAIFCNNTPERGHDAIEGIDEIAVAMVDTIGNRRARKLKK